MIKKNILFKLFFLLMIPGFTFASRMTRVDDYAWIIFIIAFIAGVIIATASVFILKKTKPGWNNSNLYKTWMIIFSAIIVIPLIFVVILA